MARQGTAQDLHTDHSVRDMVGLMAIIVITEPPGASLEMYDAVSARLQEDGPPAGQIAHAAVAEGDSFRVYDIYETQEQYDDFVENRLKPAIRAVAGDEAYEQMPDATRSVTEIHNLLRP
jgi:hypothetical protein